MMCSVRASFAQASLVAAHRRLLAVALQDPRNSMFLLVSESCIPLYHPGLLWAQLMAESHVSRVADGVYNTRRWSKKMETAFLTAQRFQKSDQWVSLTRMHAEVAAYDEHVWTMFNQYCKSQVRPRTRAARTSSSQHSTAQRSTSHPSRRNAAAALRPARMLCSCGVAEPPGGVCRASVRRGGATGRRVQVACDTTHPNYGRTCVADEHYIASLLAAYGMDESRDGIGELTYVDWSSRDGPWHPRTFYPGNAAASIHAMRARSPSAKCAAHSPSATPPFMQVCNVRLFVEAAPKPQYAFVPHAVLHVVLEKQHVAGARVRWGSDAWPWCSLPCGVRIRRAVVAAIALLGKRGMMCRCAEGFEASLASIKTVFAIDGVCRQPAPDSGEPAAMATAGPARRLQASVEDTSDESVEWAGEARRGEYQDEVELGESAGRGLKLSRWKRRKSKIVKQIQPGITETSVKEMGRQRETIHLRRALDIQRAMAGNLRAAGWLGGYEPMRMNCPLLGRRVSADAVSDFAAQAWRCDGLGFDPTCLQNA